MRRGVKACLPWKTGALTVGSEKVLNESTCAFFAFCSCNMNDVETVNIGSLCQLVNLSSQEEIAGIVEPCDRHTECPIL